MIVVGKISAKAILKYQKREIHKVYLRKKRNDKDGAYILGLAKQAGVPVAWVDDETLKELTQTSSHGGVAIDCEARQSDDLQIKETMSIMCVEGLTDPYNMGEVLRTCSALGFDALITPEYTFYEHEAKLIRASAGASESIIWHMSTDIEATLKTLNQSGVSIIGAYRGDKSQSLVDYTFEPKSCIVIGGAYRGLSKAVLNQCTAMVRIDYDARVALSTVGAVSAFAFALYSQRRV